MSAWLPSVADLVEPIGDRPDGLTSRVIGVSRCPVEVDELLGSLVQATTVLLNVEVLDDQLAESLVELGEVVNGVATKYRASRLVCELANVRGGDVSVAVAHLKDEFDAVNVLSRGAELIAVHRLVRDGLLLDQLHIADNAVELVDSNLHGYPFSLGAFPVSDN